MGKMIGKILIDDKDIYEESLDPVLLRARVGMVFQNPIHSQSLSLIMWHMDQRFMD